MVVPEHWLFLPVVVDVRSAPRHEVHLTSSGRSHTDSVFGIKWTAGRVVSVPSHNRACTLLVVLIAVVTISSCLQSLLVQGANPCSQIKTGDVTIHSELLVHCILGCIRDQFNRHLRRLLSVMSPATEHVPTARLVRQRREGGLASQHFTCFLGLFAIGCLPKCSLSVETSQQHDHRCAHQETRKQRDHEVPQVGTAQHR